MFRRRYALFLYAALMLVGAAATPAAHAYRSISFLPPVAYPKPGARDITAADFDGDRHLDLAIVGTGSVSLLYGNGDGSFQTPADTPLGDELNEVIGADVNADGRLDLVIVHLTLNRIVVILNQGRRLFAPPAYYTAGINPIAVTAADFNGDGKLDLAVSNHRGDNMCVLLNRGDGTFLSPVFYPGGHLTARLVSADWNGDGRTDLTMSNYESGNLLVYFGDGLGGFTVGGNYGVGAYPAKVVTEDFNRDGNLDLATANVFSHNVAILFGDGRGRFRAPVTFPANTHPHHLASVDLDGDGDADLAIPNNETNYFTVLVNDGTGYFLPPIRFGSNGSNTRTLAVGDFNEDGRPDVAVGQYSSSTVSVFLNSTPPGATGIPVYAIRDLGTFGGIESVGLDVNASGQVAGLAYYPGEAHHAFFFNGSNLIDLGTWGGTTSVAWGVNNLGQAAGFSMLPGDRVQRAFLWSGGTLTDLGTLGGTHSNALRLNDAGQVVGSANLSNGTYHAFLWSGGRMADLGTLGGYYSSAHDINAAGQVAGWSTFSDSSNTHAFRYSDGVMADLGTLGGTESVGLGINNTGHVVGEADTAAGQIHAFLWSSGRMTDLGTLGGTWSSAKGINDHGQIVGDSTTASGDGRPFLYQDGAMTDLNQRLPPGSGWELLTARAISSAGHIVGRGRIGGRRHGYLLTPMGVASLVLSSSTIPGCQSATGQVTLLATAPDPTVVKLTSTNPAAVVPASVTIPAGARDASFTITTVPVTTAQKGTIAATIGGSAAGVPLTVRQFGVQSVTLSPNAVPGGATVTGTVKLECLTGTSAVSVALASSDASVANPTRTRVALRAGSDRATFTVTTARVSVPTTVVITAAYGGATGTATLQVMPVGAPSAPPVEVASVTLQPATVVGGSPASGTVTLTGPAPPAGTVLTLGSDHAAAAVPTSVTVPAGATTATFAVTTFPVAAATPVAITASSNAGKRSATLSVLPRTPSTGETPTLVSLTLNRTSVTAGSTPIATVTLSGPAPPGGIVVTLAGDTPAVASVPLSVLVPAGATTATFPIRTLPVTRSTLVEFSATWDGDARTVRLEVRPRRLF